MRAHQLQLAAHIILTELHPRDVVGLGEGRHRSAKTLPDLVEQRRRRKRIAQMVRQKRHHLCTGLQLRDVGIEIDLIQTLDIQRHMPIQNIVDRHNPRAHDASPASMATQTIMCSPQR